MTAIILPFGYYPKRLELTSGPVRITTRSGSNFDLSTGSGLKDGWIHAPRFHRVFGLPRTHDIAHETDADPKHMDFLMWVLSLVTGMRLTTTEAGFLDATPIQPFNLVDFRAKHRDMEVAMALAEHFWANNRAEPDRALQFGAAVHAMFISHAPQALQFERFIYLYTALDACYALARSLTGSRRRQRHHERLSWLCSKFGIPQPAWADAAGSNQTEISAIRNGALHEALYMGQPLGFALHGVGSGQNLVLEMQALTSRLLIALLGASDNSYVRSPVTTRQIHALDLA